MLSVSTLEPNTLESASSAYRLASDGAISSAHPWQAELYRRITESAGDIGGLLLAPLGSGKVESAVIPALGSAQGATPRRIFLIGPDSSPLDDYYSRLVPYLRVFLTEDSTARTICLDIAEDDLDGNICRRFFPDGTEDPHLVTNPLDVGVDLILTTFTRFRELFFGNGGVHVLPTALIGSQNQAVRRDLFFFDEAHSYAKDKFSQFHRLVEFLFAEDLDVIVASSTLPPAYVEELSFLEILPLSGFPPAPPRSLIYQNTTNPLGLMESEIRRSYFQNSRVFGVTETSEDAATLYANLAPSYPHSVYLYHPAQPADDRRRTYAQLHELEKEGEGYLLLTTGDALETSDLDASTLFSTLCPPENLIRRAGRCNRRGDLPSASIVLFGDQLNPLSRGMNASQLSDYLAALQTQTQQPFDPEFWKAFI